MLYKREEQKRAVKTTTRAYQNNNSVEMKTFVLHLKRENYKYFAVIFTYDDFLTFCIFPSPFFEPQQIAWPKVFFFLHLS